MKNTEKQICLNPNCPTPSMRITYLNEEGLHKKCTNWLINSKWKQNWSNQHVPKIPL